MFDSTRNALETQPMQPTRAVSGSVSEEGIRSSAQVGDGKRRRTSRTLRLMTRNHLPGGKDIATMADNAGETQREGQGFGLGFAVLLDPTVAQLVGTPGEFSWGGAASTAFFVNPNEDGLIMLFLTQLRPSSTYPIRRGLRATIYASIID